MNIFEKIENQYTKKLPFVAYKKPNEDHISAFFQKTNVLTSLKNYNEKGFVFAPFDDCNTSIFFSIKTCDFLTQELSFSQLSSQIDKERILTSNDNDLKNHETLVAKAIQSIENGEFQKVVLSRKEVVTFNNFKLIDVFKRLLQKYAKAFVYVWYHPKVGLWLGATPEVLLKTTHHTFETMSLAGTQVFEQGKNIKWEAKELEEQQLVTNYIIDALSPVVSKIEKSELLTTRAGNLLHLKTKISGVFDGSLDVILKKIHPTPAVCGLPKEVTKQFILDNEPYDRAFYTGYLGEINIDNQTIQTSSLFVNLRCMQIKHQKAIIYVGGGITKDSNPTKEYQETVSKSLTMKSIL